MAGITDAAKTAVARFVHFVESHMTAATFAEADCHEYAGRCVAVNEKTCRQRRDTLDNFLENVGLKNVHVCYGFATVEG